MANKHPQAREKRNYRNGSWRTNPVSHPAVARFLGRSDVVGLGGRLLDLGRTDLSLFDAWLGISNCWIVCACWFVQLCVVLWPEPAYRNYTEDMLYGAKWRWSWAGGQILELWCFCPCCDAQLIYREDRFPAKTDFICERCPPDGSDHLYQSHGRVVATVEGGNRYYAVSAAEREIRRRIRTSKSVVFNA